MINRDEIRELCRRDPEAIVTLIESMQRTIEALTARVAELENQIKRNSRNSGKPPSTDGYAKPAKSLREKSGKKVGGQKGHPGQTLVQVDKPDATVVHRVATCGGCGESMEKEAGELERRQVFDVPPVKMVVTEHQAERKWCRHCGTVTRAAFPAEVTSPTQYGAGVKALATYLTVGQLLPVDRTRQVLEEVLGCGMSTGTICAMVSEGAAQLVETEAAIKAAVTNAAVVHGDETGLRVLGKLWWLHVASTPQLTYYAVHQKRGVAAIDAIGVIPHLAGVLVHDCWAAYLTYACRHSLCNAHLLRELIHVAENLKQSWAEVLIKLLLDAKAELAAAGHLSKRRIRSINAHFTRIIAAGLALPANAAPQPTGKGRPKQNFAKNLLDRLRKHQSLFLAFLSNPAIPFDNNLAERDIRMMKLKQKISGCFRSEDGAHHFARIRSYLSTAAKQGHRLLDALSNAFAGNPLSLVPTG